MSCIQVRAPLPTVLVHHACFPPVHLQAVRAQMVSICTASRMRCLASFSDRLVMRSPTLPRKQHGLLLSALSPVCLKARGTNLWRECTE